MKSYNKARAMKQINSVGLKTAKLPVGTKLTVGETVEGSIKRANGQEILTDYLMCTTAKGVIRVPVSELLKMKTKDGSPVFKSEEGSTDIQFPGEFSIASSEDRKNARTGEIVYPLFAYKNAEAFRNGEISSWEDLVAGGLKEGEFSPVQDYTIVL